jgi:hypothetical protein
MSEDDALGLDAEIKRLDRDKKLEELRQLKTAGSPWTRWLTPTFLIAAIPLLAAFGAWMMKEFELYSNQEAFRQLQAEKAALIALKTDLEVQKTGLNIEIQTLLLQKADYASQTDEVREELVALQRRLDERQAGFDAAYLKSRFTSDEATYALGHVFVEEERARIEGLKAELDRLPSDLMPKFNDALGAFDLQLTIVDISKQILAESNDALKLFPVSEWTQSLEPRPQGYFDGDGRIMISNPGTDDVGYYDVDEGRFLSEDEVVGFSPN